MSLNLKKKKCLFFSFLDFFPLLFLFSFYDIIFFQGLCGSSWYLFLLIIFSWPPSSSRTGAIQGTVHSILFRCIFFLQFSVDITQFQGFSYAVCVAGLWFSTATSNLSSDLQSNIFNAFNLSTWLYHRLHQCPNVNWSSSFHTRYSCVFNIRKCHPCHHSAVLR